MDDRDLLAAYVRDQSEAAFNELARRHLAWVYSVALRHVGNAALAEDVAQSVFVLLARKAGNIRSGTLIGGWLFRTTRFVANRALRAETRRRTREEMAASMISPTTFSDENEAVWKRLESHLDEAAASLSEIDRQAILLRFYQQKPLLDVGRCLGLSEEAAKKRVSRAIQKMRVFLAVRGVAVGATVLAGLMAERTVQAVPSALATSLLKRTAVSLSPPGPLPQLAEEALNLWRWTKVKMFGGVTAALCGLVWLCFVWPLSPSGSGPRGGPERLQIRGQTPIKSAPVSSMAAAPTAQTEVRLLHFRVLAKDSGEPVSGAALGVNTVTGAGWKQRFDLATDQTGSADIACPRDATRLDVGVIASGWDARFATWWTDLDGEIPAEYTLRLDRQTNSVGGWLRNDKGEPVANAVVEMVFGGSDMAQEENPRERPGFPGLAPVARSDQNGWWSCAVIPSNLKFFPGLRARHSHFAPAKIISWSALPTDSPQPQSVKLLRSGKLVTVMKRGATLRGRVLDEEGKCVTGARIEHSPGSSESIAVETDSQGWFAIPGLPSGDFDFIVTAPGFAQSYFQADLNEEMEPLQIRLKPGGILRLLLVDENGNPVENGTVALTGPGGMYMPGLDWSVQSGPGGKVEWTSAQAGSTVTICASKRPDFAMSRVAVKADGNEHVIRLRPRFGVSGSVMDARTGELVQGEIKAFPGYGNGRDSWYRGETRRSRNGTFRVYFDGEDWPWRFRVEADGYAPFVSEITQNPAAASITNIFLEPADPAKAVRGTIFRTDGQPAVRAEVALLTQEHGASLGRGHFAGRAAVDHLIIDADDAGKFAFPEEPHCTFVVAVSGDGFARVRLEERNVGSKAPMEIHLQPWGRLEGSIDASAFTRVVDSVMVDDLLALDAPGPLSLEREEFTSKPTADGRFSFDFVPPGLLCVWPSAGLHPGTSDWPPFHHPVWAEVTPGETTTVKVAETGYHVKGHLVLQGREGVALKPPAYAILEREWPAESRRSPGVNAKQWMQSFFDSGRLIIDADGNFESRLSIDPGTYRIVGRIEDVRLDQQVEVPDPQSSGLISPGFVLSDLEAHTIDLGEIVVLPHDSAGAARE
jgi:RNA polymerase sigma factor (sigma-70 family)